ncbi:MAG: hypothetical protein ACXW6J_09960 [Candidatus Binatia bacterium]
MLEGNPMNINYTVTIAKLTALALANPAIGQAQTKERAKLIEDAKKEGKVMVYVSSNASDARALEAAFEKKYPFVNMEFYSSGKDALLTRYLLEARTGANQFSSSLSLATLSVFPTGQRDALQLAFALDRLSEGDQKHYALARRVG